MTSFINLLFKLIRFSEINFEYDYVKALHSELHACNNDLVKLSKSRKEIGTLACRLEQSNCLPILLELSASVRSLNCESSASSTCTWNEIIKRISKESYMSVMHTIIRLPLVDSSHYFNQLGLASASFYLLSLTIPGAKGFHIFDVELILHCMDLFCICEIKNDSSKNAKNEQEYFVHLCTLCDSLKCMFRYVDFKDDIDVRDKILKQIINCFNKEFFNTPESWSIQSKFFDILDEIIDPHNGVPEETIIKIFNMTLPLHGNQLKPNKTNVNVSCPKHLADWFVKCIGKYPRIMSDSLSFFIRCLITNPLKTWKPEQIGGVLDYAAVYDAALFKHCNTSCVNFLCDAIYAEEISIRCRTLDLMTRIIQIESHVDWKVFLHEVSNIPREIFLINEIIKSLKDNNNTVKHKAALALLQGLRNGSPNTRKILEDGIMFTEYCYGDIFLPEEPRLLKNEIRYKKPQQKKSTDTFEGFNLVQESFISLPDDIFKNLLCSENVQVRRTGLNLIKNIVKLNSLVIYNTEFINEMLKFLEEPLPLVRKEAFLMVDSLLDEYVNCYPIIWVWCKLVTSLLYDSEKRNVDTALNTFTKKVINNIKSPDQTNKAEYCMPWVIIRTLLSTRLRPYFITKFHSSLQIDALHVDNVGLIESHLLTANSLEAWNILNLMSGKIKCKEPDVLIHIFASIRYWNRDQNMLIALEVLAYYVKDFSHAALNSVFDTILTQIRVGNILPVLVGKAFALLVLIDNCSQKDSHKSRNITKGWTTDLLVFLETRILTEINIFPERPIIIISYLFSYSEVTLLADSKPHPIVVPFLLKYINECLQINKDEVHSEEEQVLNAFIIILGRLSIRDSLLVEKTCALYMNLLKKFEQPPIVNNILIAITDISKKHSYVVERIINQLLMSLQSRYSLNRIRTFKSFEKLILHDQLKLKGPILIAMLEVVLDSDKEISLIAKSFFYEYARSKSSTIFQKCLLECLLSFNGYKSADSCYNTTILSKFKGDIYLARRRELYNFLMYQIEARNLFSFFDQLQLLSGEVTILSLISSEEGISILKDYFYIIKRICKRVHDYKLTSMEEVDTASVVFLETTSAINNSKSNLNKSRNDSHARNLLKLDMIEKIETSVTHIASVINLTSNASIKNNFDELSEDLKKSFPSINI